MRYLRHTDHISVIEWSPDGTKLLSGSLDGTVRIWNPTAGELLQEIQVGVPVFASTWSSDGTSIAYGNSENTYEVIQVHNPLQNSRRKLKANFNKKFGCSNAPFAYSYSKVSLLK